MDRTFSFKKALAKTLRVLDPIKTSPFVVPTTIRKDAPTGNAPVGATPPKVLTNHFCPTKENQTSDSPGVVFDPTIGDEGVKTPPPNDSSKASNSPPVGGCLCSFSRDWQINNCSSNVLNIITNGYVLPFLSKPNLVRFPLIVSEYKALPKDQALADCIHSLLSKYTIERVENENSRVHQDLPDSRGMGIIDRSIRHLPPHPHLSTLKEILKESFSTGFRCSNSLPSPSDWPRPPRSLQ